MSAIIPWNDPGAAPCCCIICDQNIRALHSQALPLSQEQFLMFDAGGSVTVGEFSLQCTFTWQQNVPYVTQTWPLMARKTVSFDGTAKALTNTTGDFESVANTCNIIVRVPIGGTKSVTYSDPTYSWFYAGALGVPFTINQVIPLGTGARFRYTHTISDVAATQNGVFSNYWLFYSIAIGATCASFDNAYYTGTGQALPNGDFAGGVGLQTIALLATRLTPEPLRPTTTTGNEITLNLITPLGNLPLAVTDCSFFTQEFAYQMIGTPSMAWTLYPTLEWTPLAP